jgi:hypothetical protein
MPAANGSRLPCGKLTTPKPVLHHFTESLWTTALVLTHGFSLRRCGAGAGIIGIICYSCGLESIYCSSHLLGAGLHCFSDGLLRCSSCAHIAEITTSSSSMIERGQPINHMYYFRNGWVLLFLKRTLSEELLTRFRDCSVQILN